MSMFKKEKIHGMTVIRNPFFPFPGYKAINLLGILFAKPNAKLDELTINHEAIHTAQMKERLYIFFYLIYVLEFITLLIRYCGKWNKAYRAISFEREAYANQYNLRYLESRK